MWQLLAVNDCPNAPAGPKNAQLYGSGPMERRGTAAVAYQDEDDPK